MAHVFDPVSRLFDEPLTARLCRDATLRWWWGSEACARQTHVGEEDARDANALAQRREAGAAAVRGVLEGPAAALGDALGPPDELARTLGIATGFPQEHVARGVVVAVLVHAYLSWVRDQCERVGARRVYFVSREGATLARAFNALTRGAAHAAGNTVHERVRAIYLPASRLSTFLPSLDGFTEASIARLWRQYPRQTFAQLLRNLSLPRDVFEPLAARHTLAMDRVIEDLAHLRGFFDDSAVQEAFATHRDQARAAMVSYLARKGFFEHPVVAMGDVGWKGSIQTNIELALRGWHAQASNRPPVTRPAPPTPPASSSPPTVHGVYLALRHDPALDTAPSTRAGFLADEPATGVRDWQSACVFRCGSMFEVALSVPHRCVSGYHAAPPRPRLLPGDDPLFASLNARDREIFQGPARLTRIACLRTLRVMAANARHRGPIDVESARPWLIDMLRREIVYPSRASADSFLEHAHVETFGVFQLSRFDLVTPWRELLRGSPIHWPHRVRVALEAHFWPDAIVRRSGVPLANFAFDLMLTRRARNG